MILHLFRGQYLIRYIFLFLLTLILWSDALFIGGKTMHDGGFGQIDFLEKWIQSFPLFFTIIFILILYLQALVLNAIAEINRLVERNQLLVAAIYILMMSSTPSLVQPHILILINFLLILQLNTVLRLYGKEEPFGALFDSGLLVGISSLLFFPSITWLALLFYTLLSFQFFRWREWLIPIIGFITPFLFVATWYFWFDQFAASFKKLLDRFNPVLPDFSEMTLVDWIIPVLFALLFAMGAGKIIHKASESTVDKRKKLRILFFVIITGIAMLFLPVTDVKIQGAVLIIPLAVILASYTSAIKNVFYSELIFSIIILVILSVKILSHL
jgi:hypothetical protein